MFSKGIAIGLVLLLSAVTLGVLAPAEARAEALPALDDQPLPTQVESYLSQQDGSYGVAALSLDTGEGVFVNAEDPFPAASLYKVLVMYRVFQAIEQGDLSPEDAIVIQDSDMAESEDEGWYPGDVVTVGDALHAMITYSSNVAAYALTRQVGGWGSVTSATGELGMYSTTLEGDGYWTTPQDMAHFFRLLSDRQLVSPSASQQMIDILLQQTVNDRLPALLPSGAEVAHKTGELGGVRNDGGIVNGPGGRYVLVVMSQGGSPDDQVWVESVVSRMIYQQFGA